MHLSLLAIHTPGTSLRTERTLEVALLWAAENAVQSVGSEPTPRGERQGCSWELWQLSNGRLRWSNGLCEFQRGQ